jgi:hypothetical protein
MKISELKQPYRAIAEWDRKKQNKSISDNLSESIKWHETEAGIWFYNDLYNAGIYPEITDQIKADYKEVFDMLEAENKEEFVKGEIVEMRNTKAWEKVIFVSNINDICPSSVYMYVGIDSDNCVEVFANIRKFKPVTTLTLEEVKKKLCIEGELIIK